MRKKLSRLSLIHPAVAMFFFWSVLYLFYFLAPIVQVPSISVNGLVFNWFFISVYCLFALIGSKSKGNEVNVKRLTNDIGVNEILIIKLFSLALIFGCLGIQQKIAVIIDLDLLNVAQLRNERANDLMLARDLSSSFLSGLSFIFLPAGFVGIFMVLLRYELYPIKVRILFFLFLIILFLSNVASGGRSAIFVSAIFIVLSFYIRRKLDLSAIPQSNLLRASSLAFVLIMIFYTNYIWYVRSELTNTGFEEFLSHAETVWGVTPTSALVNFADWLGRPELVKDLLSTIFYFTQCLSVGEKVLSMPSTPLLLGSYQIDLISVLFRLTPYLSEIMRNGYNDLNDFGVYGFFSGAWFSLLIDFGFFGALLFTAVWGWLSGVAFRYARHSRHLELYAFSLYAILISFVSPPLGFANSAVTFFWFFLYFFIKNRSFFKTLYHIRQ